MSYIGKQPRKAALTSSDIEDGIITAAKIEDGAVVAAEIASNAVTTAKINADAVTGAKIADNAINSEHYTNGSIDTAHIAADQVVASLIADNAINSEHYTDGSIDTAHIAADQITNAKIADDQIDSEHYVDGSIDTAHIAADQITAAKIADDAISEEHLDVTAVTGHTAETSIADGDLILIHDASASALRKMTKANFIAGVGATATAEFNAYISSDIALSDVTATLMTFQTELFDTDGVYTTSNGKFTAPSDGVYLLSTGIWAYNSANQMKALDVMFYVNGTLRYRQLDFNHSEMQKLAHTLTQVITLDSGDYVQVYVKMDTSNGSAGVVEASSGVYQNNFCGFRLPT